jgi:hypothetical protein
LIYDGGSRAVGARGLLVVLKDSMFIIALFILHRLLGPIKILSDQLKGILIFLRKLIIFLFSFFIRKEYPLILVVHKISSKQFVKNSIL